MYDRVKGDLLCGLDTNGLIRWQSWHAGLRVQFVAARNST